MLGEESGATTGRSGRRWIIDPLDGTTNYAHGLPTFAVSIGLETDKRVELGVVFDPNLDELFVAERGRGATVNDRPLSVSSAATLDESLLATGFPYNIRETRDNNLAEYAAFSVRSPRGPANGLGGALPRVARHRPARWLLGAAAGSLGRRRRQPPGRGGRRPRDEPDRRPARSRRAALVASNGRIHDAILDVLRMVRGDGRA